MLDFSALYGTIYIYYYRMSFQKVRKNRGGEVMRMDRRGFTLVELIIVIIIIGVLASIAAPMMTANVKRAKQTEALAGLGAIRTAERLYRSEFSSGTYAAVSGLSAYLNQSDLNGKYYDGSGYSVTGVVGKAVPKAGDDCGTVNMDLDTGITNNT